MAPQSVLSSLREKTKPNKKGARASHKLNTDELGQKTVNGFMKPVGAAKSAQNLTHRIYAQHLINMTIAHHSIYLQKRPIPSVKVLIQHLLPTSYMPNI